MKTCKFRSSRSGSKTIEIPATIEALREAACHDRLEQPQAIEVERDTWNIPKWRLPHAVMAVYQDGKRYVIGHVDEVIPVVP